MKTYFIDLALPEEERWAEVIAKEKTAARRVLRDLTEKLRMPRWLLPIFGRLYEASGGLYMGESTAWAEALGISPRALAAAQCNYELAMLSGSLGGPFGCTTAAVDHPKLGPVHVRYLDWDLPGIRRATRVFRFHGGDHEFVAVGIAGFVGVLSGYVPGAYSVSMNQAPASQLPGFALAAPFLVREVLSGCASYDEAVYSLSRTPVSAPVLFLVCGTKKRQAAAIERRRNAYAIRRMRGGNPLVVTNHHEAKGWTKWNRLTVEEMEDSCKRFELARDALRRPRRTLRSIVGQLADFPVESSLTVQRMAFAPRLDRMFVQNA